MHKRRTAELLFLSAVILAILSLAGCSSLLGQRSSGHGSRMVFQVDPQRGDRWPASARGRAGTLDRVIMTLAYRARSSAGAGELTGTSSGTDKVILEVPRAISSPSALKRLTSIGRLEFYYMKDVQTAVNPLAAWKIDAVRVGKGEGYVFTGPHGQILDTTKPGDMKKILAQVVGAPGTKPILTDDDLTPNARATMRRTNTAPIIEIELNQKGAQIFSDFTGAHVGEILGVFYDGKLLTAPTIREKIADGKAEISGFNSLKQAAEIADILNSHSLPVHLKLLPVQH